MIVAGTYRIAGPGWQPAGDWHLGARLREEAARGLADTEDLWHAGTYFQRVNSGELMEISAWAGDPGTRPPAASAVIAEARERAHELVTAAKAEGSTATLVLAADSFVVRSADGPDVVAGYPWFGSYLGDTMTAYEGLFLETGRAEEGRKLLRARTRSAAGPLVVDPADELVRLGDAASWPNPCTEDGPVTPRIGKPVEINALWVNALAAMADLLVEAGRDDAEPRARHARARASFLARFPAPEGWLYDVIEGPPAAYPLGAGNHHDDPSLRPNQLFAWSLPHAPLIRDPLGRDAVQAAGAALLTPLGPRTLAAGEYGYQGVHRGSREERDIAYHQGTVWPWLIGTYADACAAVGLPSEGLLTGLEAHLSEWGVGSVSETADGDPPHDATGSPFSARSVAEVLRTLRSHA